MLPVSYSVRADPNSSSLLPISWNVFGSTVGAIVEDSCVWFGTAGAGVKVGWGVYVGLLVGSGSDSPGLPRFDVSVSGWRLFAELGLLGRGRLQSLGL